MTVHIDASIDDYVLDLLPSQERRALEQHAAGCTRCMKLLVDERTREAQLRAAFRRSAAAPAGRLEAMWPGVAAAVSDQMSLPWSWPRLTWWSQWRTVLATAAVALAVLVGLVGGVQRLDNWFLGTNTPTVAVRTAVPTASMTPTLSQTPDLLAANEGNQAPVSYVRPAAMPLWSTPEPELVRILPVPGAHHQDTFPTVGP